MNLKNYSNSNTNSNTSGLTLIELLVSLALIVGLMTVVAAILVATLRGASKAVVSEDIRQNGNSALTQVTKQIQFAESLDSVLTSLGDTSASCATPAPPDPPTEYKSISYTSGGVSNILTCDRTTLALNSAELVDRTKAVFVSCKIICSQQIDESPVVGISFTLSNPSDDVVAEKRTTLNFSKSIKMRLSNQ
jgi:type II secretory pathway pseudopilin PulG